MKLKLIYIKQLILSLVVTTVSLIGMTIFVVNGSYIIHPSIYLIGILMGFGLGVTCIASIIKCRKRL